MTLLWVDWNDLCAYPSPDYITADLDTASLIWHGDLQLGGEVTLFDGEWPDLGHHCLGRVRWFDSERRLVAADIDWTTWRSRRLTRNLTWYGDTKETLREMP